MTGLFAVTPHDDGVVSLRIATDAQRHFDPAWVAGFLETLGVLGKDPAVRVVILESGAEYFSAGATRETLIQSFNTAQSYAARIPHALLALPVPVVAAMAGHAIGGGLLLGLWCDAVVLASESLYGANFMALGFTPGMGATYAVPEAFGAPLGRDLLWTGRLMTGREIRDACCPLSHAVLPRSAVSGRALAVARDLAAAPRDAGRLLKESLAVHRRASLEGALNAERAAHGALLADPATEREIARRYPTASRPSLRPAEPESAESE